VPENASPAPLRRTPITPATRPERPLPPPVAPELPLTDDWLPGDTWEPSYSYGGAEAARRELSSVRNRIERDLADVRRAIELRQRELPGWQLWPDDQLSNLRRAESELREAGREAERADRDLRDRGRYGNDDAAERRLSSVADRLAEADAFLLAARPAGRRYRYRDGDPGQNPLDPGPGGADSRRNPPGTPDRGGRPVPPDTRTPQRPGVPDRDRTGRPGAPERDRPGRPVPPEGRTPWQPRDPQNPLDPGPGSPRQPWDPPSGRPPRQPEPRQPWDPGYDRPGRPWPHDPQNPLDPGPSYPWQPQPPFERDSLTFLIDQLRWDIRRALDETRRAREYLRRELPEPWRPRPEPPPTWPYLDEFVDLADGR